MKKNRLNFSFFDLSKSNFKYKFDGTAFEAIKVEERYIDIVKLNQNLFDEIYGYKFKAKS